MYACTYPVCMLQELSDFNNLDNNKRITLTF